MPRSLALSPNVKPHPEPALEPSATPTFERVLSVFEHDTGSDPFEPAHLLVLTRLQRAACEHYGRRLDALLALDDGGRIAFLSRPGEAPRQAGSILRRDEGVAA